MAEEAERLVAVGKQLGYEGTALQEFLREERAAHRERLREVEERKREEEERERERKREDEEREKERKREDGELDRARSDRRIVEMEKEMELLRLRSECTSNNGSSEEMSNAAAVPTHFTGVGAQRLLAPFSEKSDDLDAYLTRFDRVAEAHAWAPEHWATALSTCLTGEALTVFSRMPASEALVYERVKRALLLRFRLTEEGFRKRFRTEAPQDEEYASAVFRAARKLLGEVGATLRGKPVIRGSQEPYLGGAIPRKLQTGVGVVPQGKEEPRRRGSPPEGRRICQRPRDDQFWPTGWNTREPRGRHPRGESRQATTQQRNGAPVLFVLTTGTFGITMHERSQKCERPAARREERLGLR